MNAQSIQQDSLTFFLFFLRNHNRLKSHRHLPIEFKLYSDKALRFHLWGAVEKENP